MRRFSAFITLLVCAIIYGCGPGVPTTEPSQVPAAPSVESLPVDPDVTVGKLENGLAYFIRVNHKPEKRAELRLVVNAGSVLEDDEQQGLAHLVEHMGFNGTKHFKKQELVDYVESIGMRFGPHLNAYTSFDETVYLLQVPTDSAEIVETAFQILEDWAHGMSFDRDEVDKERGVVVEEWRRGLGAETRMRDKQFPILFKDSQYAVRLPIGQKAVLDTAHYETIVRFYGDWYRPDLMAVVAVGDFDRDWIEGLIQTHFSTLTDVEHPRERALFPVPDHTETLVATASDPEATTSRVAVYYKQDVSEEGTVRAYRKRIVASLYNGMLNRRLQELTRKPDSPFLAAFSYQGRFIRTKDVYVLGSVVENNGVERGLEALLMEAERVARHGFTETELERQKRESLRFMQRAYEERDKTESRVFASEYIRHFLVEESIPGIEAELTLQERLLPEIDLKEVNQLTSEWLTDSNRVIMVNLPEKEEITVPAEEHLLAIFDRVHGYAIEPYVDVVPGQSLVEVTPAPGKISEQESMPEIGVEKWTLENGVRVFLKLTDFKNDEILLKAHSAGGHSLVEDENHISAITASAVVQEGGAGPFSRIQLEKYLAGKVVHVSPTISSLYEGISASASPKDMEILFQLIYAYFTAPRKDSTAFLAYETRMKGFLENRGARPEAAFGDTVQVIMSQHHFRRRPWTLEILDEMNLESSFTFYKDRFADASDFTFFIVGNFDFPVIRPLIEMYLGGLPSTHRSETWRDVGIDVPTGRIEKSIHRGMEPKSMTEIYFTGPFEWTQENRYHMQSMAQVLQIKLREVVREDKSGTYSVSVRARPRHYPDPEYRISIAFGSAPERVEELTKTVYDQIDSLMTYGTTEKYLVKVKQIQRREREIGLKENGYWLNNLWFYDYHGEDLHSILKYDEFVNDLSLDDIQKTADRYLNTDNIVRVVLYPESLP